MTDYKKVAEMIQRMARDEQLHEHMGCEGCGTCDPPAPAEDKNEREHEYASRAVDDMLNAGEERDMNGYTYNATVELVVRERAAARAESEAKVAADVVAAREQGRAEGRQDFVGMRAANENLAREFISLQSRHERLVAAARNARELVHATLTQGSAPIQADVDAIDAALADEPPARSSDVEQRLTEVSAQHTSDIAAAREQGRAEQHASDLAEYTAKHNQWAALQSRHERLVAAARDVQDYDQRDAAKVWGALASALANEPQEYDRYRKGQK